MELFDLDNKKEDNQDDLELEAAAAQDTDVLAPSTSAVLEEEVGASAAATAEVDRGGVDDVVALLKAAQEEPPVVQVEEVDAADSALTAAPPPKTDRLRAELAAAGLSPEQIDKIVAIKMVTKKGQRQLPLSVPATHPAMITFFANRTDEEIETDAVKGIRNDGGKLGPIGMYTQVLVDHGVDATVAQAAAEALAAKVSHRVSSIRVNVVATTNELRRRRALAAGLNPAAVKYLKVR
jgi:hypothetical protein